MTEPITRLEFAAVSVKTYEKMAAAKALPAAVNPFTDCSDTEMLKAYNAGHCGRYFGHGICAECAFEPRAGGRNADARF